MEENKSDQKMLRAGKSNSGRPKIKGPDDRKIWKLRGTKLRLLRKSLNMSWQDVVDNEKWKNLISSNKEASLKLEQGNSRFHDNLRENVVRVFGIPDDWMDDSFCAKNGILIIDCFNEHILNNKLNIYNFFNNIKQHGSDKRFLTDAIHHSLSTFLTNINNRDIDSIVESQQYIYNAVNHIACNRYQEALLSTNKAIKLCEGNPVSINYINRALIFAHMKLFDEAFTDIDIAEKIGGAKVSLVVSKLLLYLIIDDIDKFESYERTIPVEIRNDSEYFTVMGIYHMNKINYAKASDCLDKAIIINNSNSSAYFCYGLLSLLLLRPLSAMSQFKKALDLGISSVIYFQFNSICCLLNLDLENSITNANAALDISPNCIIALISRAIASIIKKANTFKTDLDKVIELQPDSFYAYEIYFLYYLLEGDFIKAKYYNNKLSDEYRILKEQNKLNILIFKSMRKYNNRFINGQLDTGKQDINDDGNDKIEIIWDDFNKNIIDTMPDIPLKLINLAFYHYGEKDINSSLLMLQKLIDDGAELLYLFIATITLYLHKLDYINAEKNCHKALALYPDNIILNYILCQLNAINSKNNKLVESFVDDNISQYSQIYDYHKKCDFTFGIELPFDRQLKPCFNIHELLLKY